MIDRKKIIEQAKKAIVENNLVFISDISAYVPCSTSTINVILKNNHKASEEISDLINKNRIETKVGLRKKLYKMENPTALIAFYKLIATKEEHEALSKNGSYDDKPKGIETKGKTKSLSVYKKRVIDMLKADNRYSPALDAEVVALASALSSLDMVNKTIEGIESPIVMEQSSQGIKYVPHPAFKMQQIILDSVSKHSKLLGFEHESVMSDVDSDPLVEMTEKVIESGKDKKLIGKK